MELFPNFNQLKTCQFIKRKKKELKLRLKKIKILNNFWGEKGFNQ